MCFKFCILQFWYIRFFLSIASNVLMKVWKWVIYVDQSASLCSVVKPLTISRCWLRGRTRFENVKGRKGNKDEVTRKQESPHSSHQLLYPGHFLVLREMARLLFMTPYERCLLVIFLLYTYSTILQIPVFRSGPWPGVSSSNSSAVCHSLSGLWHVSYAGASQELSKSSLSSVFAYQLLCGGAKGHPGSATEPSFAECTT